ncbi:MAG: hypothetical protein R2939_00090 [Kofleriaceae bacterium]
MPCLTTGGPPAKSCAWPLTITEKCVAATFTAPSPAHAPSATPTTGTLPSSSIDGQLE